MSSPSLATVKRLFAVSGNRCAFPGCDTPLVSDSGKVTGKICHIAGQRGPRYNPAQSAEERNGFDNLLLLCALHHDVVDDDVTTYTVERLREMKMAHEATAAEPLNLNDDVAQSIINLSVTTDSGTALTSVGQVGGQFAQTITNIVHGVPAAARTSSTPGPLDHRVTDALLQVWEELVSTLDATLDATVNLAPLEGKTRRQSYDVLAMCPFPVLAKGPELSAWEAVQNDYLHVMSFPHFGNKASSAIDELERSIARFRLLIPAHVSADIRAIAAQMRIVVTMAGDAKSSLERWRSIMLKVEAIEQMILDLENRIRTHVQSGGG